MTESKTRQSHAKQSLRVWIRMLRATTLIEKRIRSYLKSSFDSTLPRFDVLAALARETGPVTMSELTGKLLVSNGNVTGLVNRLVEDGLLLREIDPADRRSQLVVLTEAGRNAFREMAAAHESLVDSFFAQLSDDEMEGLLELTEKLNRTLHRQEDAE